MGARYAPVMLALRLFLPESWASKRARLDRADGASRIWHGPNEAGDCFGGDRSWWPSGGVPVTSTLSRSGQETQTQPARTKRRQSTRDRAAQTREAQKN